MNLPFTHGQLLDTFAAYNRALWPAALLLWALTIAALWCLHRGRRDASRLMAGVLALQWIWAGVAYHWVFFRAINPAATVFGGLFVLEATLFLRYGVLRPRFHFSPLAVRSGWLGWSLILYAVFYPVVGLVFGLAYPHLPTFGVPCPTTILTAGALLLAPSRPIRLLAVIPVLWSGVGGSAAFVLGIRGDFVLLLAGVALIVHLATPTQTPRERAV